MSGEQGTYAHEVKIDNPKWSLSTGCRKHRPEQGQAWSASAMWDSERGLSQGGTRYVRTR